MKNSTLFIATILLSLTFPAFINASPQPDAGVSTSAKMATQAMVNLNLASAEEIAERLIGVGLVKAKAIVEYRTVNGEFKTIDDLTQVKGIGVKTIAKNQTRILLR